MCYPNVMILASLWLKIFRCSNWSSCADFEQSKLDTHFADFGQVKIDLTCSFSLTLDTVILLSLGNTLGRGKNPNPHRLIKKSKTTHRIWYKSFSMIQSAGVKNWVPQSINRLQSFALLFLFVTRFSDFCNKI